MRSTSTQSRYVPSLSWEMSPLAMRSSTASQAAFKVPIATDSSTRASGRVRVDVVTAASLPKNSVVLHDRQYRHCSTPAARTKAVG